MKGIYRTKEGSKVEVMDFDEANKIAMIKVDDTKNRWVDEKEYSTWEKEGEDEEETQDDDFVFPDDLDKIEPEVEYNSEGAVHGVDEAAEEKPKRKRIYKKKEK